MSKYFKAGNSMIGDMSIDEIDFVVRDDNDEIVEEDLPESVLAAIQVLRQYGRELEQSVA